MRRAPRQGAKSDFLIGAGKGRGWCDRLSWAENELERGV